VEQGRNIHSKTFRILNVYFFVFDLDEKTPLGKVGGVDAEEYCNETAFMAHNGKYSNVEAVILPQPEGARIIFRAIKPIEKGAPLTIDYGPLYEWNNIGRTPAHFIQ
jgi:SET domain-containing protein